MDKNILLVEDDLTLRFAIESCFANVPEYHIKAVGSYESAKKELQRRSFDLVLSDVKMPGGSGYELLKDVLKNYPQTSVILMTGYGSIEDAVLAMKEGAYDFLVKPFQLTTLENTVKSALEEQKYKQVMDAQQRTSPSKSEGVSIIKAINKVFVTNNDQMKNMIENLQKVSSSKATILLQGESGTGKEILASMIHDFSPRRDKPFVAINCAALPDNLLESELFGHEKGSFTGAIQRQIGKFEASDGGTLFLDEISEMSLTMQTKLLRVLQECEIYRIGGNKAIPLNLRIVTSTNRDLYAYMKAGHFREDLYYRINVVPIHVLPLRERGEDVLYLTEYYLEEFSRLHNRPALKLDEYARHQILSYRWQGNVRELRNTIERAVLVGSFQNVLPEVSSSSALERVQNVTQNLSHQMSFGDLTLDQIEKQVILKTLSSCQGNRTHTAQKLGVSLRTLRNKLRQYREEENALLGRGVELD